MANSRRPQFFHRDSALGQLEGVTDIPSLQTVGYNLRVKLESKGKVIYHKCLIFIKICPCQWLCARRQVKGVSMPVKDGQSIVQERRQPTGRMLAACILERLPADFSSMRAGIHLSAGSSGHELRAQADAKERFPGLQPAPDAIDLSHKEGIRLRFINADGTAENDQEMA